MSSKEGPFAVGIRTAANADGHRHQGAEMTNNREEVAV